MSAKIRIESRLRVWEQHGHALSAPVMAVLQNPSAALTEDRVCEGLTETDAQIMAAMLRVSRGEVRWEELLVPVLPSMEEPEVPNDLKNEAAAQPVSLLTTVSVSPVHTAASTHSEAAAAASPAAPAGDDALAGAGCGDGDIGEAGSTARPNSAAAAEESKLVDGLLKLAAASSATGNDLQARDAYSQALELQPMNGVLLYKR